ncbi:MAG: hypothetical protein IIC76_01645 [Bacteroidetes bacterium]|nr:hypothetical protein [Bacteroidota bacterium]
MNRNGRGCLLTRAEFNSSSLRPRRDDSSAKETYFSFLYFIRVNSYKKSNGNF